MPKPRSKNEVKEYAIYLILSPIDMKQMYIGKTYPHRLRKTYTEHLRLRVAKTREMCSKAAELHRLPPLYILEECKLTSREAFRRCVAWTRYFLDLGYMQITEDILTEYAQNLVPATQDYYDLIKSKSIEDILLPKGGLFANYGTVKKPHAQTDKHIISIRFDPEEYLLIRQKSHLAGLSMGQYCKDRILNSTVIYNDHTEMEARWNAHEDELILLKQILFSVYKTHNYYPADIKNIQFCATRHCELIEQTISNLKNTIMSIQTPKEVADQRELTELVAARGDTEIVVSCIVSENEYTEIKQRAETLKMRVSFFCHSAAKHGRLIVSNYRLFSKISEYYLSVIVLMQQIMFTIYKTGKYYPPDLALIQSEIDTLRNKHVQYSDALINYLHQLQKELY